MRTVSLKWVLAGVAGLIVLDLVVFYAVLHFRLVSNGAYQQAIALAQSSPELKQALGEKITVKLPAIGLVRSWKRSEFVVFSVSLHGTQGSGHLYALANTVNGDREFWRLSFQSDHSAQRIDLTPTPSRMSLPPVPEKTVYLVPVGFRQSLDWAPAYYKAKFGINVVVLPAIKLEQSTIDVRRHQVASEQLTHSIAENYPDLAADPSALLIGVTSHDIFIQDYGWRYAENYRQGGRFAVVSSARFRTLSFLNAWNPEWFVSRLKKMLTKNIALLYFDLPLSGDKTSLLSGGVLSGREVDLMGSSIIGTERRWHSFFNSGDVQVAMYSVPGKPVLWRLTGSNEVLPQVSNRIFDADLTVGLFIQRNTDFRFDGKYPLQFTRVYRNQDPQSRSFGIGTNDSLDIFLIGEMGVAVDLIYADGARVHFKHVPGAAGQTGDTYVGEPATGGPTAVFDGSNWTVKMLNGWQYRFPYRPHAKGSNVTVLTGFTDPSGNVYEMVRDDSGDLMSVNTPDGQWLHFGWTPQHTIRSITASSGRIVRYEYDDRLRLSHVADTDGHQESYAYDDHDRMVVVADGQGTPMLTNTYGDTGNIETQTTAEGEVFRYHYTRAPKSMGNALVPDRITAPNGLVTLIRYNANGYLQSLPISRPN